MKVNNFAKKHLGQHFLVDQAVIAEILQKFYTRATNPVVEIGPGLGALTHLLIEHFKKITCIEIDARAIAILQNQYSTEQLDIIAQDVLNVSFDELVPRLRGDDDSLVPRLRGDDDSLVPRLRGDDGIRGDPSFPRRRESRGHELSIIGNLPYNISTPILFHLFKFIPRIKLMFFMLQNEVIDRIVAAPNNKDYGRLSVMCQAYCKAEKFFEIAPTAFDPPPKVNSAMIMLTPYRDNPYNCQNFSLLEDLVRVAFNHRRKTILNNLKHLLTKEELEDLNIDPRLRPENLSVQDYVTIANHLCK